jgi:hypothetical protein
MKEAKFDFYEKVIVESTNPNLQEINGELCTVMGRVFWDEQDKWLYAIHPYSRGEGWDVEEEDLISTGEFDKHENFYSGESIRVKVNENGDGEVVE